MNYNIEDFSVREKKSEETYSDYFINIDNRDVYDYLFGIFNEQSLGGISLIYCKVEDVLLVKKDFIFNYYCTKIENMDDLKSVIRELCENYDSIAQP